MPLTVVGDGQHLTFDNAQINAPLGSIGLSDSRSAVLLQPGTYFVLFHSKGIRPCDGGGGAVGVSLETSTQYLPTPHFYASAASGNEIATHAHTLISTDVPTRLMVTNHSGNTVHYEMSSLSIVKLA